MNKIIRYFVENSFVVNLITLFVLLLGIVSVMTMKRDLIPPFEFKAVMVSAYLPGASSEEVEKFVTFPLEEGLRELVGVEQITSTTNNGSVEIQIYYQSNTKDMNEATEDVRSVVQSLRAELPQNVESITVQQDKVTSTFLMYLSLENFNLSNLHHRMLIRKFKDQVLQIKGVSNIWDTSRKRDIYVQFDPIKLRQYHLSTTEIRQKLLEYLTYSPVGQITSNEDTFSVELSKFNENLESLRRFPVAMNSTGQNLTLGQVADVDFKLEKQTRLDLVNGEESVLIWLRKGMEADTIDIKDKVEKVINDFNDELKNRSETSALKINILYDGPHFIQQQLDVLKKNGIVGLILVLCVLILFLNSRIALMTALGIPVAYFGAFAVLSVLGISIDLISIIGLILVLGMLVDDAIIVSERYSENLEKGLTPKDAAFQAAKSLMVPVTGTVLTTAVAFAPILFLSSEMAIVLFAVPIVIISTLTFSWFESFFILPNHLYHFVKRPPNPKATYYFNKIKDLYSRMLYRTLKWRYAIILLVTALLGVSGYIGLTKVEHNFNLSVNSEQVSVFAVLKQSSSLQHSLEIIKPIQDHLMSYQKDQIENVTTNIGNVWMNGRVQTGYRYVKIRVYLNRNNIYPSQLRDQLLVKVNQFLEKFPKEEFEELYAEGERQANEQEKAQMVSVRIMGSEEVDFATIEKDIEALALKQSAIQSLVKNNDQYQKSWEFAPDNKKLVQYGVSSSQVAQQIRGVFVPNKLLETRFQGEKIKVYTNIQHNEDLKLEKLAHFEVHSSIGTSVPLAFLGKWREKQSLDKIMHRDGSRNLTLDFKFDSQKYNATVAKSQLRESVAEISKKYPSYKIEVIDASDQETKSRVWAIKVAVICISLVLLVLAFILGSLTQPLLVGMPIPTGIVGIVWALYLHDLPMGVMALIGLLGTVGVSVNASLIMVDEINKRASLAGYTDRKVIVEGAVSRFRAIFLTTVTTLGGVIPMAYAFGGESGFTQPLAFSMGWGLSFATLLTLFVLPALLEIRLDFMSLLGKMKPFKLKGDYVENGTRTTSEKPHPKEGDGDSADGPSSPL